MIAFYNTKLEKLYTNRTSWPKPGKNNIWGHSVVIAKQIYFGDDFSTRDIDIHAPSPEAYEYYFLEDMVDSIAEPDLEQIKVAANSRERIVAIESALERPMHEMLQRARGGENFRIIGKNDSGDLSLILRGLLSIKIEQDFSAVLAKIALSHFIIQNPDLLRMTKKGLLVTAQQMNNRVSRYEMLWHFLKFQIANSPIGAEFPSIDDHLRARNLTRSLTNQLMTEMFYRELLMQGYIVPKDPDIWARTKQGPHKGFSWHTVPFVVLKNEGLALDDLLRSQCSESADMNQLSIPEQTLGLVLKFAIVAQTLQQTQKRLFIFPLADCARRLGFSFQTFRRALQHERLMAPNGSPLFIFAHSRGTYLNPEYPKLDEVAFKRILGPDWEARIRQATPDSDELREIIEANSK